MIRLSSVGYCWWGQNSIHPNKVDILHVSVMPKTLWVACTILKTTFAIWESKGTDSKINRLLCNYFWSFDWWSVFNWCFELISIQGERTFPAAMCWNQHIAEFFQRAMSPLLADHFYLHLTKFQTFPLHLHPPILFRVFAVPFTCGKHYRGLSRTSRTLLYLNHNEKSWVPDLCILHSSSNPNIALSHTFHMQVFVLQ